MKSSALYLQAHKTAHSSVLTLLFVLDKLSSLKGRGSMDMRDEFAKAALQGLLSNEGVVARGGVTLAISAYGIADAMLARREVGRDDRHSCVAQAKAVKCLISKGARENEYQVQVAAVLGKFPLSRVDGRYVWRTDGKRRGRLTGTKAKAKGFLACEILRMNDRGDGTALIVLPGGGVSRVMINKLMLEASQIVDRPRE